MALDIYWEFLTKCSMRVSCVFSVNAHGVTKGNESNSNGKVNSNAGF